MVKNIYGSAHKVHSFAWHWKLVVKTYPHYIAIIANIANILPWRNSLSARI
jgi:hypothetical protein